MAEISLKNISKSYGKKEIIENINLDIKDKEFVVLVGPSGCGKSTILRMIAGLEPVTKGELFIDDLKMNKVAPKDRDIAFVFQNYALYPHLSIYDNMAFSLKTRRIAKRIIEKKVLEAAEILGLEDYLKSKPKQLSGGQRQRVALGRAIVREPKVFLMDEPLSNLDAKLRIQMRNELKQLHKKLNTTFIYVTHDQIEAMTMGEKVVVLNKGEVQQIGTPLEIYKNPANKFVAGFIGTPPMNFIKAKVDGDCLKFSNILLTLDKSFKEMLNFRKEVIIGIRPENMVDKDGEIKMFTDVLDVETLGAEKNVRIKIGNEFCTVKLNSDYYLEKQIVLSLNTNKMFFFDTLTGERLYKN